MTKEEMKLVMKESLKEWMDEKFITFGKWSLASFAAACIAGVVYFILWINGWAKHP
jgi:hypothetical protein